jgi:drug/metabolite transporter (DMT)-like permease
VHASWNFLVARSRDPQAATAVGGVLGALLLVPPVVLTWDVDAAAVPYAAASSALHVVYFALLALAYTRADLSVVYPLARGSAPVLVLVGAVLVLGESPSALQALGVVLVGTGVMLIRGLHGGDRTGELLGLAVGVTIAAYTVIDKQGVEHAAALPYLLLLIAPSTVVYCAWMARRRGKEALLRELRPVTVLVGAGMVGAYGLTLAALQLGPASGVAAARETSILVATLLGALFLGERVGPLRALGAAAVVGGVAAVALG